MRVRPRTVATRVLRAALLVELLLLIADLLLNHLQLLPSPLRRSFNLAREDSIGTWWSVVQLGVVGLTALALRLAAARLQRSAWTRRAWSFLACFFLYMSVDDAAMLHERVGSTFKRGVSFFPSYAWQILYAPLLGSAVLVLVWLTWRVFSNRRAQLCILLGLGGYVLAVGMDFVEGLNDTHRRLAAAVGCSPHTLAHISKALEEVIEMAGTSLLLCGLLLHLGRELAGSNLQIEVAAGPAVDGDE